MFFRIRGVVMTPGWMGQEISPKDSAIGSGGCWQSGTSPVAKMSESPTRQQAPTAISAFSLMTSQPSQASNFGKQIDEASIADISNVSTVQQLPKITFKDRTSTRTFVLEIHLDVRDEQCVGEAQGRCKYYSILLIVR
jgi:hypothetical protein